MSSRIFNPKKTQTLDTTVNLDTYLACIRALKPGPKGYVSMDGLDAVRAVFDQLKIKVEGL